MKTHLNGYDPVDFVKEWTDYNDQDNAAERINLLPLNATLLFAYYTDEDYYGVAFGLYEQDGKLYEVNGSHCSCHGLEGQWEPEEARVAELRNRATRGSMWHGDNEEDQTAALLAVLDDYERRRTPVLAA